MFASNSQFDLKQKKGKMHSSAFREAEQIHGSEIKSYTENLVNLKTYQSIVTQLKAFLKSGPVKFKLTASRNHESSVIWSVDEQQKFIMHLHEWVQAEYRICLMWCSVHNVGKWKSYSHLIQEKKEKEKKSSRKFSENIELLNLWTNDSNCNR